MNYNLYSKGSKTKLSQIWLCETIEGDRLRWYTGFRIKSNEWNGGKPKASIHNSLKADLEKIDTIFKGIKIQLDKRNKLTAYNVKYLLNCESIFKAENFINEIIESIRFIPERGDFLESFQAFIDKSISGERKTKKGKKIEGNTVKKYLVTQNLLKDFTEKTGYVLNWKNINDQFYNVFTDYCWNIRGHYDNHVGTQIANIMAFLNWCVEEKIIPNKIYSNKWVMWKEEEVDALVLYPDEIQLLYKMTIEGERLNYVRDTFLFGCFTCLRAGNLLNLTEGDIQVMGNSWYINPIQVKTDKPLLIKLHEIPVSYIQKYRGQFKTLLPEFTHDEYSYWLKVLGKKFKEYISEQTIPETTIINDWNKPFTRVRYRQGKPFKIEVDIENLLNPHTERSTGITNLLMMGMREFEVKKISGHSKDSKAFGKYVRFAQKFIDAQSDAAWDKIFNSKLKVS